MLRPLLALVLGAIIVSAAGGASVEDAPSPPKRDEPVASFAYVEPVRRDGAVAYVIRVHGAPPADEVKVRVLAVPEGGGKGDVLFRSDRARRTRVSLEGFAGAVPGAAPDGRPWPLVFTEPPPPGAADRRFKVDLDVNGTVTVQHLSVFAAERRWHTLSDRIIVVGRPKGEQPRLAFKEAQEQNTLSERLLTGRAAIAAATGFLLIGLAIAVQCAPREDAVERPSPERRGTEGRGLLVMLIAVALASGAMLLRHFVER